MSATLQILPVNSANGSQYMTAHLILTPAPTTNAISTSPKTISERQHKLIRPKSSNRQLLAKKLPSTVSDSMPESAESNTISRNRVKVKIEKDAEIDQVTRSPDCRAAAKKARKGESGRVYRPKPASMQKRNARERNRVKQVNQGFAVLATHVPDEMRPKKMSKVETLKTAIKYIAQLREMLGDTSIPLQSALMEIPDSDDIDDDDAFDEFSDLSSHDHTSGTSMEQYTCSAIQTANEEESLETLPTGHVAIKNSSNQTSVLFNESFAQVSPSQSYEQHRSMPTSLYSEYNHNSSSPYSTGSQMAVSHYGQPQAHITDTYNPYLLQNPSYYTDQQQQGSDVHCHETFQRDLAQGYSPNSSATASPLYQNSPVSSISSRYSIAPYRPAGGSLSSPTPSLESADSSVYDNVLLDDDNIMEFAASLF